MEDLLKDLKSQKNKRPLPPDSNLGPVCPDFSRPANHGPNLGWSPEAWNQNGNGRTVCLERTQTECEVVVRNGNGFEGRPSQPVGYPGQLPLDALLQDEVARPILEKAARLESVVEIVNPTEILVRYLRKIQCANLTPARSA
jgi:hypothetical protein